MNKQELLKAKRAKLMRKLQSSDEGKALLASRKRTKDERNTQLDAFKQINWLIGKVSAHFEELQSHQGTSHKRLADMAEGFSKEIGKVEKALKSIEEMHDNVGLLDELRDTKKTLKELATRKQPAPVVNVPAPVVNVKAPDAVVIDKSETKFIAETKYQEQTVKALESLQSVLEKVVANQGEVITTRVKSSMKDPLFIQLVSKNGRTVMDFSDVTSFIATSGKSGDSSSSSGGGTSMVDDDVFTVASSQFTPIGGTYRTTRDAVSSGDGGALAMNQRRGLYVTMETPNSDTVMDDVLDAMRVEIIDGSGAQITSFGGGAQYTEGDVDTTITGTAFMWEDTGDTMRAVSADKPLPVNVVAGGATAAAGDVAHDEVDSGNPVKMGLKAYDPNSMPADVAASDRVNAVADLKGRQIVYQGTMGYGEDSSNNLMAVQRKPIAVLTYAWSKDVSAAYEASTVTKATAGILRSIDGHNSLATPQFIQVHNKASLPANGVAPDLIFYIPGNTSFSVDFGEDGWPCDTGIVICNSSTGPTKTLGSADCWFGVRYI